MQRRQFIVGSTLGLTVASRARSSAKAHEFDNNPFSLGIASGDVTDNSAVIWTRVAPDPMAIDGGMPDADVAVNWQLALDSKMEKIILSGTEIASSKLAHSVHVDLQGLGSDQEYWYRFSVNRHQSDIGRTKTLPSQSDDMNSVRFVTASCQNYAQGSFVAYRHIVADKPDFVVHLGDYIYETSFGHNFRKHDSDTELHTLADFRRRHALYKTDPDLRLAHAQLPFFAAIDNHDAVKDNNPMTAEQRAAAYQAWYEHMPTRGFEGPGRNQFQLSRSINVGKLLRISLLDTRQFRDKADVCIENRDPNYGFGIYRQLCKEVWDEKRTMLGEPQEKWLQSNIKEGGYDWHAIASTGPFMPYRFLRNKKTIRYIGSWDAYPANRRRVVEALNSVEPGNTVLLSGDVHSFWASDGNQIEPLDERIPAVEFVTSSISAGWPMELAKPVSDNRQHNPQLKFYDPDRRGYLLHNIDRTHWRTTARAVDDVKDDKSGAVNLAEFTVTKGKPGFTW